MVQLDLVQSSNASLVSQPLVAVFIGGTSGIGAHTIRSLASTHGKVGKGLRAYIIGRNAEAAGGIIIECQKSCPTGQFRFIRANDLALMKDVDLVCAELSEIEKREAAATGDTPRIDILVQTQANFKPFDPRNETSEGLDNFMSLIYYSRMRFTTQLLPLLLASTLPAHVISVYGPGRDSNFIPEDVSLRSPKHYGFGNAGAHAAYLTTFFMEYLAAQNPGKLALTHYFPGLVLSEVFQDPTFPFWFRAIFKYGAPLMRLSPMTLDGEVSGARTLFNASPRFPPRAVNGNAEDQESTELVGNAVSSDGFVTRFLRKIPILTFLLGSLLDGERTQKAVRSIGIAESSDGFVGGGAYRVNYNNEQVATGKQYKKMREEFWLDKCVKHTFKAWEEIEAGGVFTG